VNVGEEAGRFTETMKRGLVAGSPETVTRQLRELQTYGMNHVIATVDWGDMDQALVERSLRLVATEVLPALN
jgi:hypothetical protein